MLEIGRVAAIYRYPIKSMASESLAQVEIDAHGVARDRLFAFRRVGNNGNFPWLTARQFPQMLLFEPFAANDGWRVRAPDKREFELDGEELRREIEIACNTRIELTRSDAGIFDEANVSIISRATLCELEREFGAPLDALRFRPNFVVETAGGKPFEEENWIGQAVIMGENAVVKVTHRDQRCAMINLDPETAESNAAVLKLVARANCACAGVYATVEQCGAVKIGNALRIANSI